MLRFLRESVKEFDHVVWPTRRETVRYFTIVVSTIVAFAIFLFIIGTAFSSSIFALRNLVKPASPVTSAQSAAKQQTQNIDLKALLGSGASATGTAVPVTVTDSASGSAK